MLVKGLCRNGKMDDGMQLVNVMKMKNCTPDENVYGILVDGRCCNDLCKAGRSEEACKLLLEMKDRSINPGARIFQRVVYSLENEGKRDKVVEVVRVKKSFNLVQEEKEAETRINQTDIPDFNLDYAIDVDNQRHSQDGHTVLLKNHSKQMQSDSDVEARCILERDYADSDFQKIRGIILNNKNQYSLEKDLQESEVTFTPSLVNAVLHSCQKHGYVALRFFSWVGQQSGYCHTTDTYNMAIKITGSAKYFRYMRGLLAYMRSEGFPITANTWTIIVIQYGRAGLTNSALLKFKEMKDDKCKPNASTYKYLIMFLCGKKGRNIQATMQVFQEMLHAGFMPDKSLSGVFLTSLCEEGKLIDARKCVDDLQRRGCFTSQIIYSILIKGFSRVGKMSEALELGDEMKNWGCVIDEYVYGSLLPGLLREGQVSKALEMLDSMRDAGYLPTVHIYTALIIHFFRENKSKQALWFVEEMKNVGCEPTVVTHTTLIRGYMNEGLTSNAWNTFNLMKEKGPPPDFETYSTFIHCLCRAGK
jgi:pentatricopeptide repeat protein